MWIHTIPLLNPSFPSSEPTRRIQLISSQICFDQVIPRIWSILLSKIIICWELISRRRDVWVLFYSICVLLDRHKLVISDLGFTYVTQLFQAPHWENEARRSSVSRKRSYYARQTQPSKTFVNTTATVDIWMKIQLLGCYQKSYPCCYWDINISELLKVTCGTKEAASLAVSSPFPCHCQCCNIDDMISITVY